MSLTNPDKLITEQDLKDFYDTIYPYLGSGGSDEDFFTITPNTDNVQLVLKNRVVKNGHIVDISFEAILKNAFNPSASWPTNSPVIGTLPEEVRIPSAEEWVFTPCCIAESPMLDKITTNATIAIYSTGLMRARVWDTSMTNGTFLMVHTTYSLPE